MKQLLLAILLFSFLPSVGQKQLMYSDKVYEPQIKTVLLYAGFLHSENQKFHPAATSLQSQNLILAFDDLQKEINNYQVRLIHCNADWTKSSLMNLDFLEEYNEFMINDYEYTTNTFVPYVHYAFQVPPVKQPGNYVLVVYRNYDQNDIVLSRRFFVFDNRINIRPAGTASPGGSLYGSNQQINFVVSYQNIEIVNPQGSIRVVIRQNDRWDNAQMNVLPSFVREDIRQLEYRFFENDKFFNAGNEFRFVDFRSVAAPGINTLRIDHQAIPNHLYVQPDKSRANQLYSHYVDINGNYTIDNLDWRSDQQSSTYVNVTFTLQSPKIGSDNVYLIGAFNNWDRNNENMMRHNSNASAYEITLLLKQGWYNYQYLLESLKQDNNYFEGNHFQTENVYEILVYYRPFQPNTDLLIGYQVLPVNPR